MAPKDQLYTDLPEPRPDTVEQDNYDPEIDMLEPTIEIEEAEVEDTGAARATALNSLAEEIETMLRQRMSNRTIKEQEWTECAALYYGSMGYAVNPNVETPFQLKSGKRQRPGFNIIRTKCDAAIAQCVSMQFGAGEKNWDIWPSANDTDPTSPARCALMSDDIETQLDKCRYPFEVRKALEDRIIYGAGILKGPVNTGSLVTEYKMGDDPSLWTPEIKMKYNPVVTRVNPWYFFPDDSVNEPQQIQNAIEIHPMSPLDLSLLRKNEGYEKDAITEVLKTPPSEYATEFFTEYMQLMENSPTMFKNKYCVIEYHGPVSKATLYEYGLEPTYESPDNQYFGEVWCVNGKTIRIELENIEGSYETPYCISAWKPDPGSVFGFGHPLTMRDQQRVVTQSWHMILDNAAVSSGPQAAIQKRFIQPADGEWEIEPRKIWHLTDPMMKVSDAIEFFFPPNVIQHIIPVLDLARQFSEEESATPMLAAGMQSGQNSETATGSLVNMQNSTTLLDLMSEQWDDQITQKVIRRMYAWNMLYGENVEAKGNYVIDVRSSNEYKNKQIHVRDVERLSMEMAQNPAVAKWINPDALVHLRLSMMSLPSRAILRTPEEADAWEKEQQAQAQQNDPNAMKMQVEMKKLELAAQQMQLDMQQMQSDQQIAMAKLQMEHETNQTKNQVAMLEAQAMQAEAQSMAMSSQLEHEAKLIELELKAQEMGLKYNTDASKTAASNQTAVFLKGMDMQNKARELDIQEQEISLKKQGKTGI